MYEMFAYVNILAIYGDTIKNLEEFLRVTKKYDNTFNELKHIIRTRQLRYRGMSLDPIWRLEPLKELLLSYNVRTQERLMYS